MNFCTRCGSYYERPGTCNCYAVRIVPQVTPGTGDPPPGVIPWPADPYRGPGWPVGPIIYCVGHRPPVPDLQL